MPKAVEESASPKPTTKAVRVANPNAIETKVMTVPVTSNCALPQWLDEYFADPPRYAAVAGDGRGYLVLQWPDDYPLQTLAVPDADLRNETGRAIIATAARQKLKSPGNEDICYRYFAPQHGVAEDTATGSAMRILADYWDQREGMQSLVAFQCSTGGGMLYSTLDHEMVNVGGRVESAGH